MSDLATASSVPGGPVPPKANHEIPIGQILAILWRGRWVIAICAVLSVALGFAYVMRRGNVMRVSAEIQVQEPIGAASDIASLFDGKTFVDTQVLILKWPSNFEAALKIISPANVLVREVPQADRKRWLGKVVSISKERNADIIKVTMESKEVEAAAEIVNAVAYAYTDRHHNKNRNASALVVKAHLATLDDAKKILDDLRAELDDTIDNNPGLDTVGENITTTLTYQLWVAEGKLLETSIHELAESRRTLERAKVYVDQPEFLLQFLQVSRPFAIEQERSMRELETELGALKTKRNLLRQRLKAGSQPVVYLDAEIDLLAKQIETDRAVLEAQLSLEAKSHLKALANRVEDIEKDVAEGKAEVVSMGVEVKDLGRAIRGRIRQETKIDRQFAEVSVRQETYMSVLDSDRLSGEKDLKIALEEAGLDSAKPTRSKSVMLAVFLFLGLMAGAGIAWLRGMMDQKLRSVDDLTSAAPLPVLSIVPQSVIEAEGDVIDNWESNTSHAESIRSLRTAVYFGMPPDEGKVIQVTSPESGDGKSTISAALAIAMAQAGQRTLVIDADMRRPTQATLFGLESESGLSTVLATGAPAEEHMHSTRVDGLMVLPSGPIPANPTELLNGRQFGKVLEQLSDRFDRIIIDSPPVMPVADARIIATKCEATVLTCRVDKSTRKGVVATLEHLAAVGARVLGGVLNDMPRGIGYGYGYGGGYSRYGYGGYGDDASRSEPKSAAQQGGQV